jgi:hypothetical protein
LSFKRKKTSPKGGFINKGQKGGLSELVLIGASGLGKNSITKHLVFAIAIKGIKNGKVRIF